MKHEIKKALVLEELQRLIALEGLFQCIQGQDTNFGGFDMRSDERINQFLTMFNTVVVFWEA